MPLKPESFFDATADAGNITLLLDSEGTILEVSENVESVLGYSSDNLLNKSPFSNDDSSLALIPSPFRAKYKEDLALISQSTNESNQYQEQYQGNHPNEVTLLTKEGDKVRMMIQKIIQLNDNQVEFVFRPDLRFTKILKKAVEIFKGLRQRLEDSKKGMAAKTSFWANTIHELRTPMIAIEGFVDLLLKNEKKTSLDSKLTSEEILKYLKIIKTAGTSSKILINDQLDLAKIESGKVELVLTNFDIKECVQEVSQIALNNKTGVTISSNCELDNSIIKGDKQRIGQILTNLLSNAVKFTEEGKITVNISHNANTNLLEIAVTDPGIGIPKNRLTAIFEPFTQASSSTTQQYGGTGLGLPISKELAKLMKGNLTVKSDEGSGSTFTF
ncbi:MAG: PAS domain-containing sensor histidine kinase, partial [Candidatus Peregrinibacteria bacterium]|nr:PAS domain-containing sensor histidine kinase [Candidatus Peregrinibacteria bacterium]